MAEFRLRGVLYEIENAPDLLLEQLVSFGKNLQNQSSGDRQETDEYSIARLVQQACPSLPKNIISYKCIEYPDGGRDRSGSVFAFNLHEVAAFIKALTIASMETRAKEIAQDLEDGEIPDDRVKEAKAEISNLKSAVTKVRDDMKNIRVDALLRTFKIENLPVEEAPKKLSKGFTPHVKAEIVPLVEEDDAVFLQAQEIEALEEKLSKLRQNLTV